MTQSAISPASPLSESEELRLIRRTLIGDDTAFTELYTAHYYFLFRHLLKLTRHHEDAEDLTQDTFIQARRKLNSFRGASRFGSWLHKIAINKFLMQRRGARREEKCIAGSIDALHPTHTSNLGHRDLNLAGVVDRETLAKCVDNLPSGQRRVFLLHADGYRHTEVAAMHKRTVGNVKSQLYKAKYKIRRMLLFTVPKPPSPNLRPIAQ